MRNRHTTRGSTAAPRPCRLLDTSGHNLSGRRSGFMLVEALVALILLVTVVTMVPLLLRTVYQQRQQERFCRFAQIELANTAVRLRSNGAERDVADNVVLSEWFRQYCPDATMQVTSIEASDFPAGVLIYQITIRRPNGDERPDSSQALTVWVEAGEEPAS